MTETGDRQSRVSRREFLGCAVATSALVAMGRLPAAAAAPATAAVRPGGEMFSFLHLSDTHLDPRLEGQLYNPDSRSKRTLGWIGGESRRPVIQEPYGVEAPPPAFALHTGDVFEYGAIGPTWDDFDRVTSDLGCPLYAVPGNHDNTWSSINAWLRTRHGGDSYSFDHGGCHFVNLNSSGLLEPLPCLDRRTLDWLRDDLAKVPHDTPVFLALHHPMTANAGYASEYDRLRLWQVIRRHHVVLMLDGHYHSVHAQQWQGLDRVNGGSTFGRHTGFGTVTVRDGRLRVAYRYEALRDDRGDDRLVVPLLDKPLARPARRAVELTLGPLEDAQIRATIRETGGAGPGTSCRCWVDGDEARSMTLQWDGDDWNATLDVAGLTPGLHFVQARVEGGDGPPIDDAAAFEVPLPATQGEVRRVQTAAGVKAQPLLLPGLVVVGDTAGHVTAFDASLAERWRFAAAGQIVHALAASGGRVLVGDDTGVLYALDAATGEMRWRLDVGSPLYGRPLVAGKTIYLGDGGGGVHAIDAVSGVLQWSRRCAPFAIESGIACDEDRLYVGAWDGQVYALNRDDGAMAWHTGGPSAQGERRSRYYGPADCPPVIAGDRLWVVDRGYAMGIFTLDGRFERTARTQVVAIASDGDGGVLVRTLGHELIRMGPDGEPHWTLAAPTGRVPTPPVRAGDVVAVVSDRGGLTLADAETGRKRLEYALTPQLFVMAPAASRDGRAWYTADMDGVLTAVTLPSAAS